jgi:hypothetical protein
LSPTEKKVLVEKLKVNGSKLTLEENKKLNENKSALEGKNYESRRI